MGGFCLGSESLVYASAVIVRWFNWDLRKLVKSGSVFSV